MTDLLTITDLNVDYASQRGNVRAVDNVSFSIRKGEIFGLAGESGCGKSTTAFAICRLLRPPAQITSGSIRLNGTELTNLSDASFDKVRWSKLSIVLQSAMNNLNPVIRIGEQLADAILAHVPMNKFQLHERLRELLNLVDLPEDRIRSYPHELSGGMRQRVVIAMALALNPDLIIMDEPTTALDVVIQDGIIRKVLELQKRFEFSVMFISHDLPLMLQICNRIGVMYAGKLIEVSDVETIMNQPSHPYTKGLLESFPSLHGERRRLRGVPGYPPDLITPPSGCRFHPRCPYVVPSCNVTEPPLRSIGKSVVACHLFKEGENHGHASP